VSLSLGRLAAPEILPQRHRKQLSRRTEGRKTVSAQAVATSKERDQRVNIPKDNWLGFVGDVVKFSGEVTFRTSLRIDGHFSGQVISPNGTLVVSTGANLSDAVINVAVAKINGIVEGQVNASEVVLGRTAKVTGDVSAESFIVEDGALFNGRCRKVAVASGRARVT
jgi:cytoskeletal protein CcmA (bactofilin family)